MKTNTTIEALRGQIAALNSERKSLEAAPVNAEIARANIDAFVKSLPGRAEGARKRFQLAVTTGDSMHYRSAGSALFEPQYLPGLLASVWPDQLVAYLSAGIENVTTTDLSPNQVTARLAEIDAELDRLELREEALIDKSERDGQPIERRPDARPEIILALQ